MANDEWMTVDPATLPGAIRAKYDTMKAQYREYAKEKEAFEQAMQEAFGRSLGEGKELKFGYKFGKLSISVGERRARKTPTTPTLVEWLGHHSDGARR